MLRGRSARGHATGVEIGKAPGLRLIGTRVVCVCNLGPKNIAGFTSELLILGVKDPDGKVIVLSPRSGRGRRTDFL